MDEQIIDYVPMTKRKRRERGVIWVTANSARTTIFCGGVAESISVRYAQSIFLTNSQSEYRNGVRLRRGNGMDERIVDYIPMTEKRREKWDKRNLIAVKCPKCKTRFVLNRDDADNYFVKDEVACPECGFTHYHWSSYTTPNFMYNISKFIRRQFYEDDC